MDLIYMLGDGVVAFWNFLTREVPFVFSTWFLVMVSWWHVFITIPRRLDKIERTLEMVPTTYLLRGHIGNRIDRVGRNL